MRWRRSWLVAIAGLLALSSLSAGWAVAADTPTPPRKHRPVAPTTSASTQPSTRPESETKVDVKVDGVYGLFTRSQERPILKVALKKGEMVGFRAGAEDNYVVAFGGERTMTLRLNGGPYFWKQIND